MAFIVNTTASAYQTPATTYPVTLGAHVDGDLLLVCLTQDGGGATDIAPNAAAVTAGWAMIGTQAASQSSRQAWAYKYVGAGEAPVADPTFTGNNDDWIGACNVVRNAHATTPIRSWMRSDWGNSTNISTADSNAIAASSAGGTNVFTPLADSLLMYSWNCDGGNSVMRTKLDSSVADSKYGPPTGEPVNYIMSHRQLNATSVPSVTMYANTQTEGGNGWVVEIANVSGGTVQPTARVTAIENVTLANWFGDVGARQLPITWAAPSTFCSAASINGITLSTATPNISTTTPDSDSLWGNPTQINDQTNGAVWAGGAYTFASTDVSGKMFGFAWGVNVASTSGRIGAEGIIVVVGSSVTDWAAFQVTTKLIGWKQSALNPAFVELDNATVYASVGTVDYTAITRVAYLWNKVSGVNDSLILKNATLFTLAAITGGSAAVPSSFKTLTDDLGSWGHWRLADKQASSQIQGKFSTQIGDGTSYTYFDSSASSFEFPRAFSVPEKTWNVNPVQVALSVYGKSGDTINLAAGVSASESQQLLTINASHDNGATFSVAGESFVGFLPTWKTGTPASNVTFSGCGIIDFKGADIVSVIGKNGTGTAFLSASNGFSATGSALTASATCLYGIRIAAAGTFDLESTTFSGFTEDLDVTAVTGTVTVNLASGQATPTHQTAGATVTFVSSPVFQTVTVSNITATSRLQIYDTTNSVSLYNGVPGATSYVWTNLTAAATYGTFTPRVRIADVITTTAKQFIESTLTDCGTTTSNAYQSYRATQVADTTYNTNGIDGSTVTLITFVNSGSNDRVDFALPGGSATWPSIYAAFVYWIFTSTGIADDIAYIEAPDTANYLLTAMKARNTDAADLTITGGYGRSATTGLSKDIVDTAGSTGNIFLAPDHVIPFSTGSGLTAGQAAQLTAIEGTTTLSNTSIAEIAKIEGLTIADPVIIDNDAQTRVAGTISQTVIKVGNVTTIQRL